MKKVNLKMLNEMACTIYGHTHQISWQSEVNLMFKAAIGIIAIAVFIGFTPASPIVKKTLEKSFESRKAHSEIRFELGKNGVVRPVHFIEFESPIIFRKLQETNKN